MLDKNASLAILGGATLAVLIATGQESLLTPHEEWRLKSSDAPGMVHFTIDRYRPGSRWTTSTDVPFSSFRGLSSDTIEHGGPAKFEYVQDAGSLICQGNF